VAQDDAVAALVRVYDDPSLLVNVSELAPCARAYVAASGLPPATTGLRFAWRDPAGVSIAVEDVATNAQGECSAYRDLRAGEWGPGWTVAIEQWDGVGWTALDVARHAIGDGLALRDLTTDRPTYDLADHLLRATG